MGGGRSLQDSWRMAFEAWKGLLSFGRLISLHLASVSLTKISFLLCLCYTLKIRHKHLRHVLTLHFSLKVPVNCKLSSSHVTRLQLCCVGSVRTRLHFPWESPAAGSGAGK